MDRWYLESRQSLFGSLDAMLDDARANRASLNGAAPEVDALIGAAAAERAEIEALLESLATRHAALVQNIDEIQRALAVAGVPLRGEIS